MDDRMFRNMMQSMGMNMGMNMGIPSPFDDMFHSPFPGQQGQQPHMPMNSSLMPHSFMSPMMMMNPFGGMQQMMSMANNSNGGMSFCSSSVTSYTTDEQGRPQVFQQSHQVNQGPDGVKETKSSLRDTRTGRQEMSIGHHIKDKAHIKKKAKNTYTGDEESTQEFINLEEEEAGKFEKEWTKKAKSSTRYLPRNIYQRITSPMNGNRSDRLAITSSANGEDVTAPLSPEKPEKKDKKKKKTLIPTRKSSDQQK